MINLYTKEHRAVPSLIKPPEDEKFISSR